jgi:hypothetical protein
LRLFKEHDFSSGEWPGLELSENVYEVLFEKPSLGIVILTTAAEAPLSAVDGEASSAVSPFKQITVVKVVDEDLLSAGQIFPGDVILAVNGAPLNAVGKHTQLKDALAGLGRPVRITLKKSTARVLTEEKEVAAQADEKEEVEVVSVNDALPPPTPSSLDSKPIAVATPTSTTLPSEERRIEEVPAQSITTNGDRDLVKMKQQQQQRDKAAMVSTAEQQEQQRQTEQKEHAHSEQQILKDHRDREQQANKEHIQHEEENARKEQEQESPNAHREQSRLASTDEEGGVDEEKETRAGISTSVPSPSLVPVESTEQEDGNVSAAAEQRRRKMQVEAMAIEAEVEKRVGAAAAKARQEAEEAAKAGHEAALQEVRKQAAEEQEAAAAFREEEKRLVVEELQLKLKSAEKEIATAMSELVKVKDQEMAEKVREVEEKAEAKAREAAKEVSEAVAAAAKAAAKSATETAAKEAAELAAKTAAKAAAKIAAGTAATKAAVEAAANAAVETAAKVEAEAAAKEATASADGGATVPTSFQPSKSLPVSSSSSSSLPSFTTPSRGSEGKQSKTKPPHHDLNSHRLTPSPFLDSSPGVSLPAFGKNSVSEEQLLLNSQGSRAEKHLKFPSIETPAQKADRVEQERKRAVAGQRAHDGRLATTSYRSARTDTLDARIGSSLSPMSPTPHRRSQPVFVPPMPPMLSDSLFETSSFMMDFAAVGSSTSSWSSAPASVVSSSSPAVPEENNNSNSTDDNRLLVSSSLFFSPLDPVLRWESD